MNAVLTSLDRLQPSHSSAFQNTLSEASLREQAPAVFAAGPHERTSPSYTFLSSARILDALASAGFLPVEARQAMRSKSPLHARHLIRLRRRCEQIALRDTIPEILVLTSHDARHALHVRCSLFRVVCTNGLIASHGAFPVYTVPHRGDVVEDVIAGALKVSAGFGTLAAQVERMEQRRLLKDEQLTFAERALALRFADPTQSGVQPAQLLTCRRAEDLGDNLWVLLNRVQEHLCKGGLSSRSASGRRMHTRAITSIDRGVQLNTGLWDLAMEALAA